MSSQAKEHRVEADHPRVGRRVGRGPRSHEDRALQPARVLAVHRGRYAVRGERGEALVPVAGALEAAASDPASLPAVGDWVALRSGEAIRHVLPRRTLLARADDDARREALAANVDL